MVKKHTKIILGIIALVMIMTIPTVYAYMYHVSDPIENELVAAKVDCEVNEVVANQYKNSITVKNNSNINAYLRVQLTSYWKNIVEGEEQIIFKQAPEININLNDGWIKGSNDTYYYTKPIAPNESTSNLLKEPLFLNVEGNYLQVVDVYAEAIQSKPDAAIVNSWKVTTTDNTIITVP